jgi:carbonic anhydrase/acetyltransferase-like protein (isoleucine patch superfamily)
MQNPAGDKPIISNTAWISGSAAVIGNVRIGDNVFVGPNAVIRADEPGTSIEIGKDSNVQDNVVIHGIAGSDVVIGERTSLAHGCIVHGPCRTGKRSFIGFGAVVFDCMLGDDVVVLHNATVQGVTVPPNRTVPTGSVVTEKRQATALPELSEELKEFKRNVVEVNLELVRGYLKTVGRV